MVEVEGWSEVWVESGTVRKRTKCEFALFRTALSSCEVLSLLLHLPLPPQGMELLSWLQCRLKVLRLM